MKTVPLSRGYVATVDDDDFERVIASGPWHANPKRRSTYAQRSVRRADRAWTTEALHTFLTGWSFVDHRNGDGLDNRRCNLRQATRLDNARNARLRKNISGYKGVYPGPGGKRWKASIRVDGCHTYLGLFDDPVEAARAYDAAARKHFGEFARPNFPPTPAIEEYAA